MDSNPIEKMNCIAKIYRKKIELREKIKYNLKYKNCYFGKNGSLRDSSSQEQAAYRKNT